jgi:hypothetical protein
VPSIAPSSLDDIGVYLAGRFRRAARSRLARDRLRANRPRETVIANLPEGQYSGPVKSES